MNMTKIDSYKLIDGTFSAEEAGKILLQIVNNKINYHSLQSFSIKERFNGDVSHSEKRIKQLIKVRKSLLKALESASKKGLALDIHCSIEMKPIKA